MSKTVIRIFIIGFIWVASGIVLNISQEGKDGAGIIPLAIGLLIESLAFLLFFWNKIKNN